MLNLRLAVSAFLVLAISPTISWAHPGHGNQALQNTPVHFVSEPMHAVMWLGLLVAAATVAGLAYAGRLPRWR